MARRKQREGLAEAVVHLTALMPWWLGLVVALVVYLLLHWVAQRPTPVPTVPGRLADVAIHSMTHALAWYGQYLLPALCVVGALISFARQRKRQRLVQHAITASSTAEALHGMSWMQFEQLVAEGFKRQGYQVAHTGRAGPDGGIDVELRRDGELHLVQCKQWRAQRVGVDVVRELYGVMSARGAASGLVVSAGEFTREAARFAEGRNLRLITGAALHQLLKAAPADSARANHVPAPEAAAAKLPACPTCGSLMTLRTSQRGTHAGQRFWGCARFPACRGTRRLGEQGTAP